MSMNTPEHNEAFFDYLTPSYVFCDELTHSDCCYSRDHNQCKESYFSFITKTEHYLDQMYQFLEELDYFYDKCQSNPELQKHINEMIEHTRNQCVILENLINDVDNYYQS